MFCLNAEYVFHYNLLSFKSLVFHHATATIYDFYEQSISISVKTQKEQLFYLYNYGFLLNLFSYLIS
jgi:hypothetical protein